MLWFNHAPAGRDKMCTQVKEGNSNHAHAARVETMDQINAFIMFHPRTRRDNVSGSHVSSSCFNPRAHAGATGLRQSFASHTDVSIHAPRGRLMPNKLHIRLFAFNPSRTTRDPTDFYIFITDAVSTTH